MKKIFLASSALALAAAASAPVEADTKNNGPSLTISGGGQFAGYFFKNSNAKGPTYHGDSANGTAVQKNTKGGGTHFSVEDSWLAFDVDQRLDLLGGMDVNWRLGLDVAYGDSKTNHVDENRLRLRGEWGALMLGNHQGVENFMATGAFQVNGGTGGSNGNFDYVANKPTGVYTSTDLAAKTSYATKITYVTPRLWGVQLGASYTPDTLHKGEDEVSGPSSSSSKFKPRDKNHWALGANWKHGFENGMEVTLSFTSVFAQTKPIVTPQATAPLTTNFAKFKTAERHNTQGFAYGAMFKWKGFEAAVEYVDNTKSREIKNAGGIFTPANGVTFGSFNAGSAFDAALGYTYGVDHFSVGFYNSKRKFAGKDSKAEIYSLAWDRTFAKGLSGFVEVVHFDMKTSDNAKAIQDSVASATGAQAAGGLGSVPNGSIDNNRGHAFILGTKIRF